MTCIIFFSERLFDGTAKYFFPSRLYFTKKGLGPQNLLMKNLFLYAEAATGGLLQKKVFLKISNDSHENTCARVSF